MSNNEVRIIGGQWRGRRLTFPDRQGLRPTLGRVRETLFNWLAPYIQDSRCLDLYAGSGALGFEALSRGAAEVTFVERDRKAAAALKANAERLAVATFGSGEGKSNGPEANGLAPRARILQMPAERFLRTSHDRFDLILFDPPFADQGAFAGLAILLDQHLAEDGYLYLETSRSSPLPLTDRVVKSSSAGDCQFALYQ